jgi:hypothetical protein
MKQKLWKRRKQLSLSKVVLYSNEGDTNKCTYDTQCTNNCGKDKGDKTPGVNYRCGPPKSLEPGARNIRCRLDTAMFC